MKGTADESRYSVEVLEAGATVCDVIDSRIHEQSLTQKNAFFVADLGVIWWQHVRWRTRMSAVRPYYAVRCNSSPAVIEVLAALGTGFVCTNKNEMTLVKGFGVSPEDIIFGGVCKQLSQMKYAAKSGISLLVCDNETELNKIARCHPRARLLLQVAMEPGEAEEELAMPFGSSLKDCRHLLESAKKLGVQVVGVKFHIPSSCQDPETYSHAVSDARCVFDMGEDLGFHMNILDVGGGFSGSIDQLEKVYSTMKPLLDVYFPASSGVSLIAEPGSYYVSSAFTLAVNVIAKKVVARDHQEDLCESLCANDEPEFMYYMNDGVYGSFAYKLLEESVPAPTLHKELSAKEPLFSSSLWGPSMDGLDQVVESCLLPELSVGDWLVFSNTGANSMGGSATEGDQQSPHVHYTVSSSDWYDMQDSASGLDTSMKKFSLVSCSHQSSLYKSPVSTPA
ncbi:antizyme inhibitor 1a isoform X1 [Denticeps clupeoides]|uniref:antizyme inhibitor 1a isoform X1 n=2 Tax=Denticeps clupeoides TaxID=299321 RepID=UPI0010A305C6|nr:antizyme inhibitor 1 isoform X1 [Denticeps clupeoides]